MTKRIVNPTYSYVGDDVISYSATVELVADDGTTVIDSFGVSVSQNQQVPEWAEIMAANIKQQIDDYVAKFGEVYGRAVTRFPAATSVAGILAEFTAFVEQEVNV